MVFTELVNRFAAAAASGNGDALPTRQLAAATQRLSR